MNHESHMLPKLYVLFCVLKCRNWCWSAAATNEVALFDVNSIDQLCESDLDEMEL